MTFLGPVPVGQSGLPLWLDTVPLASPLHWILRFCSQADKSDKCLDRVDIKSAFSSYHFLSRTV